MIQLIQLLARFAAGAVLIGCVAVLIGVASHSLHWSVDLVGQFLLPAIIVACLAALIAGVGGMPLLAAGSLGVAILAALTAGPWTRSPGPVPVEASRFSVLLFNVWWRNQHLDRLVQMVRRENPDIVVLLEATPRLRSAMKPLEAIYPYHLDCVGNRGCDILIFSRSRLVPHSVKFTQDAEHSPVLSVTTENAGCRMMMLATHMTRPFPNRPYEAQRAQAEEIGSDVAAWHGAKLVVGDFNGAPWGTVMRTISSRGNVEILTGGGGTWPSFLPQQLRIPVDHMLVGPGLSFISRRLLERIGSDHVPVLAEIAVTDPLQCK
jgi:endonuclease/exonuclease/phosphatase (EEP) superfamily protein YafD